MTARNYDVITSEEALRALVEKLLAEEKPIGFDVETGYLGPDRKKGALNIDWDEQFVAGFSITNSPDWARYIPVAHDFGANLPSAWDIVKPVLETLPVIAHHLKFEKRNLRALQRKGYGPRIEVNGVGDSMLQSYVLSKYQYHGLKPLVKEAFGHEMAEIESLFPGATQKQLEALRFNVLDPTDPEVVSYACEDAAWCLALHDFFAPLIEQRNNHKFMYSLEMMISDLLCDMEDAGHATDWEALAEQAQYAEPFKEHMTKAAREGLGEMAGTDYSGLNLGSAKQMREALYGEIGLSTTRLTKGGEASTDAQALETLSREHPAVKKVLEVREVGNLAGRLKKWINDYSICYDQRVHANFNQVVVGSGRFSANDPSIQQLPKEWRWTTLLSNSIDVNDDEQWNAICSHQNSVFGKHFWTGNFRDFLIAGEGCYLIGFDYSQIELRALAGMSREKALLDAFDNDEDVHTLTAAMMLGIPVSEVTDKKRAIGKTMNFALLYGMEAKSLSERLAISLAEAERLYDQYFSAFTDVTKWMSRMKALGMDRGYAETHFGRKWTLWDLQSPYFSQRSKGERLCVNAPVQGTAADIMKIAMLRCKKALEAKGWWMTKVRMINNLHDALTFEADNSINPIELRELLQECVVWEIPTFPKIVADWELGQKWGSSVKWKAHEAVEFDGENWKVLKEEKPVDPEPQIPEKEEGVEPVPDEQMPGEPDMIVELAEMPDSDSFGSFIALLKEHPGSTLITLKTPQGSVDLEKYRTDLTVSDQGVISLTLGGAKVYYPTLIDIEAEEFDF